MPCPAPLLRLPRAAPSRYCPFVRLGRLVYHVCAVTLCFLVLASGCGIAGGETLAARDASGERRALPRSADQLRLQALTRLRGLSTEQKAAQVLLIGVDGCGVPSEESLATVGSLCPGGVVLFGFNIGGEAASLGPFVAALQDAAAGSVAALPLIVALDHEGGAVFRFKGGMTRLPPPSEVGLRGAPYARLLGERAGLELRALGVNLALAPVVELLTADNRALLEQRSYGRNPEIVDAVAGAFIEGLQSAGVAATAKHFPGNAGVDPHRGLPRLDAQRDELARSYYPRFAAAIGHGVGAVLLSHVLVPAVDPERPATLSHALVTEELEERLGFEGLVITDDLYMGALSGTRRPERSAVEALAAGADLLMLSSGASALRVRDAIVRAVETGALPPGRLDDAAGRVIALKLRFAMAEGFDGRLRAERLAALPSIVEESRVRIEQATRKFISHRP